MHASHAVKQQNFGQQGATPPAFTPFIPASQNIPEFTLRAIILGIIFGMLFGAVTVSLGLKIGLTVNASIPIAVLAIMVLKKLGNSSILENNLVQTIGSAGESVAGGVIFTIPAMIFLGYELEYWKVTFFALCGGWLGLLFMIPLRRALIVKEHGVLPYPEGTACADILIAGEKRGVMAKRVFQGVGLGIVYKMMMAIGHFWKEDLAWTSKKAFPGMTASLEPSPELLGVGYIIGPRSASIMVAGSALAWMCLIPLIKFFGSVGGQVIAPGAIPVADMAPGQIWSSYVRYIGAGAVVVGGFYNLIKALPMIIESFTGGLKSFSGARNETSTTTTDERPRTERDMPNGLVAGGAAAIVVILWGYLNFVVNPGHLFANIVGAILMVIMGFFFVTVSCRVVGTIGTTSNPISGDTIATLMITCLIFLLAGWTGGTYALVALSVGAVVCIAAANAGNTSQDLKTGYIVGATPKYQQIGLMLGVTFSAFVIGGTLMFANKTYRTFTPLATAVTIPAELVKNSTMTHEGQEYRIAVVREGNANETLPVGRYLVGADGTSSIGYQEGIGSQKIAAPQGRLMSLVIDGILNQKLPWGFIIAGAMIAMTMILCGVTQVLAFAVGVYLPLATMMPVFVGGMVRALVNKRREARAKLAGQTAVDEDDAGSGSLYSSGLVAGGALGGIVAMIVFSFDALKVPAEKIGHTLLGSLTESDWLAVAVFSAMAISIYMIGTKEDKSN